MAQYFNLQQAMFFFFVVFAVSSARQLPLNPTAAVTPVLSRLATTATKGATGGTVTYCWDALLDLKSCSNEMILFFINGDSYLTVECCRAIVTITEQCWWTSMLSALGFTTAQIDVLRGYCGGSGTDGPPPPPAVIANPPASSA